ncbi:transporter [Aquimarina sp. 2201CG1-2-11]|uniref:OmpP1/FadL family transporter n=1 Tax=Aquimarina discodermiae TaxID=3231043 RepID=UPI003461D1FA
MKKLFTLIIAAFAMPFLNAQDITDALRYSQQDILGTARYRGMSGAFGALGGDLSALQINPAGSAVFLNSYGSVTLSTNRIDNDALYFSNFRNRTSRNLNFGQLGAVFIFNNTDPEAPGVNKVSLGIAYDQTTDNADKLFTAGRSSNSIDSFFINEAQGLPLGLISRASGESIDGHYSFLGETEGYRAQQAFLGYESFIVEPTDDSDLNGTTYTSNIGAGVYDQEYSYESTGINGKLTINAGAQINKDFYVGANLSSHFINYDKVSEFFEGNNNATSNINEVLFTNRLSTIGGGFSAQIGGIAKVSKMVRVGASFESPTWYYIREETSQRLETFSDADGRTIVNPDVINIFPEYRLRTPGKATGSIAFLFEKQGLISIDYSYKDYTTTKLSSDEGADFSALNTEIDTNLQGASTIRIGTEWRNGNWSFRGGYSFEESPYKNTAILDDKTGYSIGGGYNFGKYKFDVTYNQTSQQRSETFYPNSGFGNTALIDTETHSLTFTLGMNF